MTCRELMTPNPQCCLPADTVEQAARVMRDADVGPVPIVESQTNQQLLGMVTDRDLAIRVIAEGRDARTTRLEEIMSRGVISCRAEDEVDDAIEAMEENQVRRIPVVDDDGLLIGMISQADVARALDEEEAGEMLQEISEPEGFDRQRPQQSQPRSSQVPGIDFGRESVLWSLAGVGAGLAAWYFFGREESGRSRSRSPQRPGVQRSQNEHVAKIRELIQDVRICMLSTENERGVVHSRPMYTQRAEFDGDLWFFTYADSAKVREIERDPRVNVSFSSDTSWVSVSGQAQYVQDRGRIAELWRPDLKAFFPKGKDDPNIALLKIHVNEAEYWDSPSSTVVRAYGLAKALATGKSYQEEFSEHEKVQL